MSMHLSMYINKSNENILIDATIKNQSTCTTSIQVMAPARGVNIYIYMYNDVHVGFSRWWRVGEGKLIKCKQYDRGLRGCFDLTFCEVKCPRKNWNAGKHTPVH